MNRARQQAQVGHGEVRPDETREFYRLSGGGNDFLAFVNSASLPGERRIREWCRRGTSIGADGVFQLSRSASSARMVYHNADGSRGSLCLNGCRCAAQLAFFIGWWDNEMLLETDLGTSRCRQIDSREIEVDLPIHLSRPRRAALRLSTGIIAGYILEVGVPHLVLPWKESLREAPVQTLGSELRHHPSLGPDGANVNFVRYTRPSRYEIRTFERGVEAETLACGTGVIAATAVGAATDALNLPATALTAGGYELGVTGTLMSGALANPSLRGDARVVSRGELLEGASELPDPSTWSP